MKKSTMFREIVNQWRNQKKLIPLCETEGETTHSSTTYYPTFRSYAQLQLKIIYTKSTELLIYVHSKKRNEKYQISYVLLFFNKKYLTFCWIFLTQNQLFQNLICTKLSLIALLLLGLHSKISTKLVHQIREQQYEIATLHQYDILNSTLKKMKFRLQKMPGYH